MMIPAESLTKGLPIEFANFLNYVKTLRFEEKPDYQFLKN
jgi:casein kinase I family protein HRR25